MEKPSTLLDFINEKIEIYRRMQNDPNLSDETKMMLKSVEEDLMVIKKKAVKVFLEELAEDIKFISEIVETWSVMQ